MTIFRRLQMLLCAIGMAVSLLSRCAAQGKAGLASSHPQRTETNALRRASAGSAAQDVETLFALVSVNSRKRIQGTIQQFIKAGDDYPYTYHLIQIAPYVRRYRIEDWKPMRVGRGTDGGMAGNWAEVAETGQTGKGTASEQGTWSLYHRIGGRWQRVAFHEGIGYEPDGLRKARVPRKIIRRLKLETNE